MASVLPQSHATDKQLLDAFSLDPNRHHDGGFAAGVGMDADAGIFLHEDDSEMGIFQRLQAAIAGAGAAAGGGGSALSSGATTALASSSASSDSGADAHGDDKDACTWAVGSLWVYWDIVWGVGACVVDWPSRRLEGGVGRRRSLAYVRTSEPS